MNNAPEYKHQTQTGPIKQRPKQKKKNRAVTWFLNLLIVVLIVTGVFLIARPRVRNYITDKKTEEVLSAVQNFDEPEVSVVIGEHDYKVPGEQLEELGYGDEVQIADKDPAQPSEIVNMYATLEIPSIELTMPVANEATLYSLRIAVGHWSPGQRFGQQGNAVIFGHRMDASGRHFNRLAEVAEGDQLLVTTYDALYVYEVTRQRIISPVNLLASITEPTQDARLILVTCTLDGVDRLLVYSNLVEVIPISR